MQGFFTKKELESSTRSDGRVYSCSSCGLYKKCNSPKMKPFGEFHKEIMIIGEAPGEAEDMRGKPWQGRTGKLLQDTLDKLRVDLFKDCVSINAVKCRPVGEDEENINPTNYQIECCRRFTLSAIDTYRPKLILLLGNAAIHSLIGHRWKKELGGVSKWRGWQIPDIDFQAWLCPTFHPSYVERSFDKGDRGVNEVQIVWEEDLRSALWKLQQKNFPVYKFPKIDYIEDLSVLREIKSEYVSIDWETTGKKPHAKGHEIVSAAVADREDHAYSFLMPKTREKLAPLIELLANPDIGKIAHNMKFEEIWSVVKLRQSIENWKWDSMLAAHCLDNRSGITGLKFQSYVTFGLVDYASEIEPYLHGIDEKDANSLNRIHEFLKRSDGVAKLLKYGGYDAVNTLRLANIQKELIELPF